MIADKLDTILLNTERVFAAGEMKGEAFGLEVGYQNGINEGRTECSLKHYTTTVMGDGSRSLSFKPPFLPDHIAVCAFDPLAVDGNTVFAISFDRRSFWRVCFIAASSQASSTSAYTVGLSQAAMKTRNSVDADGTITVYDIPAKSGGTSGVFQNGVEYLVIATKYTDKTDRERITEYVAALPENGSGTLTLAKVIVAGAFTTSEYEALFDTRPGYTFTLS